MVSTAAPGEVANVEATEQVQPVLGFSAGDEVERKQHRQHEGAQDGHDPDVEPHKLLAFERQLPKRQSPAQERNS